MADSFDIQSPDLADFAADLKAAPRELQSELYRGLNSVTKELTNELRQSAGNTLPSTGGLAAMVARATIRGNIRKGQKFGVTMTVRPRKGDAFSGSDLDKGFIGWRSKPRQSVEPGWFEKPWQEYADDAVKAMLKVVNDIADKIVRG